MDFLLILIGFVLLIKGADILVDGGSSIAKKFGISSLVIGLTIVAFGTSAPEFVVSMLSASEGKTDLSISNILGSNISNIFLILGATAIIFPVAIPNSTRKKEIPFLIFIAVLLGGLLFDGVLSKIDGIIFLVFFSLFLYYTFLISKKPGSNQKEENIKEYTTLKSSILILLGLIGLVIGGTLIVDSAVSIAESFGLSEAFIGVTIVAIGTSLPELAASLVAAFKKNTDMAIGGIVGSNIFNVLWIGGATATFFPIKEYNGINTDLTINLIASIILLLTAYLFKKNYINKNEGIFFLVMYFSYIGYLISNI